MGKGMEIAVVYRDEDITARVVTFLKRQHFPSFQDLLVDVLDGKLTIRGKVDSFYEKQVAMSTCQKVPGVRHIVDHIAVE